MLALPFLHGHLRFDRSGMLNLLLILIGALLGLWLSLVSDGALGL